MVLHTPPDRDRCRWRVEVYPGGRVRVFELAGQSVASTMALRPQTIAELGQWLVERDIDPERLEQV